MKRIYYLSKKINLIVLLILITTLEIQSVNLYSIVKNGKWNSGETWSNTSGGVPCGCTPSSTDNVYIEQNVDLNTDLTGGSAIKGILNINGSVTLDGTGKNVWFVNGSIVVIDGTLITADFEIKNAANVTVGSTGTVTTNGDFINNSLNLIVNGNMNVGGDIKNLGSGAIGGVGNITFGGTLTNNGTIGGSSGSGVIKLGASLPVEISSIKIKCTSTGSLLVWTTQSEINNNYFSVEKSSDMLNWKLVSTIKGAFNSNELRNYDFLDRESNSETAYYRIKQTNLDGKYTYYDAKSILCSLSNKNLELVGINVSEKNINLIITSQGFSHIAIELYDLYGRKLRDKIVEPIKGANISSIEASDLKAGIYFVTMIQDGVKITKKIYLT